MPKKRTAREYLIETVREMMDTRSLESISVAQILRESGVSKSTFYRLFQDKQDLVEQVFLDELSDPFFYDTDRPLYDRELDILRRIDENRAFYQHAARSEEFVRAWMGQAIESNRHYMRVMLADHDLPEDVLEMCARMMSNTFATASFDWIRNRSSFGTPEEYARMLVVYLWQGLSGFVADPLQLPVERPVSL